MCIDAVQYEQASACKLRQLQDRPSGVTAFQERFEISNVQVPSYFKQDHILSTAQGT